MTAPGGGLTQWLGVAGVLILLVAVAHWLVKRKGGWGALRRRIAREFTLTARAFSEPVRAQLRYRRRMRLLIRLLGDRTGWADAERAVRRAAWLRPDFRPFGALLGDDWVGVLVAGGSGDAGARLPRPWLADALEPRLWWIPRVALAETVAVDTDGLDGADGLEQVPYQEEPPLLVCVGTDGYNAVLLDLYAGPATVSVYGVPRTARAVVQAIGAQLDVRLPAGSVEVTSGVHPHHHGRTLSAALADPGSEFVVSGEPADIDVPGGVRMVSLGVSRGRARLLEADAEGRLRLHGAATSWSPDVLPLPRAVARVLMALPPYPASDEDPPVRAVGGAVSASGSGLRDDLDELRRPRAGASAAGVSAVGAPGGPCAGFPGDDDFSEAAGPAARPVGVSASAGTRVTATSAAPARTREASRSNPRRTQGTK